jgi:hypothetical protein
MKKATNLYTDLVAFSLFNYIPLVYNNVLLFTTKGTILKV